MGARNSAAHGWLVQDAGDLPALFRQGARDMADDDLEKLVEGLTALKAGGEIAQDATQDVRDSVSSPKLKQALEQGTRTAQQWSERIDGALDEVGGPQGGEGDPILQAHFDVSRRIRRQAADDKSRDLGSIAAGQLALHYSIASFGALANYAKRLECSGPRASSTPAWRRPSRPTTSTASAFSRRRVRIRS